LQGIGILLPTKVRVYKIELILNSKILVKFTKVLLETWTLQQIGIYYNYKPLKQYEVRVYKIELMINSKSLVKLTKVLS
jgi:hypothetical protein